ncbi:TPA: hypothetical protein ACNH93_000808 [Citrobacter koseri]
MIKQQDYRGVTIMDFGKSKIIGIAAFIVSIYCIVELTLMALHVVDYEKDKMVVDIIMLVIMVVAFIRQKRLF